MEQFFEGLGVFFEKADCYVGDYRLFRRRLFKLMAYAFVATIIAALLNLAGLKAINLVAGYALCIFILYAATTPEFVGVLLLAGIGSHPRHPIQGSAELARSAGRFIAWLVLITSIFFLIAGTLNFERNLGEILVIDLAIWTLFLIGLVWDWSMKIAKPIIYGYAVAMLVIGISSLIGGASYQKVLGFDPYRAFRVTPIDRKLDELNRLQEEHQEGDLAKQLDRVVKKVKDRQPLSAQEQNVWDDAKKYSAVLVKGDEGWRDGTALLPKAMGAVSAKLSSSVSGLAFASRPAPAPRPAKFYRRTVQEKKVHYEPGKPTVTGMDIQVGDTIYYSNPTAPFQVTGANEVHTISESTDSPVSCSGRLVINGYERAGDVTIKLIPHN